MAVSETFRKIFGIATEFGTLRWGESECSGSPKVLLVDILLGEKAPDG